MGQLFSLLTNGAGSFGLIPVSDGHLRKDSLTHA